MKMPAMAMPCIIMLLSISGAHAQEALQEPLKVGQAELIRNEVVSVGDDAELIPVKLGDEIVRDETLKTSADSHAKFSLVDDTKLSLGPASVLTIDRAVYSGEKSYREIAIKLTEGTFRFVTGHSEKKSYVIETPTAVIGVRGTVLDIKIDENQTLVSLQSGQASVCANGGQCTQLLKKGHTANVTRNGNAIEIKRDLKPSWTFASICAGAAGLCASPLTNNPLKKTDLNNLPGSKVGDITRFCPDGRPMLNGNCGTSQNALGTTPLLNSNPLSTATAATTTATSPLDTSTLGSSISSGGLGANLPRSSSTLDTPAATTPSLGRGSLPSLRR